MWISFKNIVKSDSYAKYVLILFFLALKVMHKIRKIIAFSCLTSLNCESTTNQQRTCTKSATNPQRTYNKPAPNLQRTCNKSAKNHHQITPISPIMLAKKITQKRFSKKKEMPSHIPFCIKKTITY